MVKKSRSISGRSSVQYSLKGLDIDRVRVYKNSYDACAISDRP